MQKGNGVRALMLSLIGFAMIIFIPWLCVKSTSSAMNYLRNGTEVQCRVVSVEEHRKGKQLVHAVYTDDTGEEILAEATMNRRTSKGESFTALVIDADPEKVYCPPSNSLIAVFAVIMTALWISGKLKGKMEIIPHLLKMGMPLEQALQATHLDEKTYRENLAKHADKN